MPIRVLSPEVANGIAAGEVIERPASVVKELVENALDAGASEVTIEVAGGGARLIRVADNGCGIPAEEVALAFERHATSKLADLADLQRLATLGFRGEALPSIAAVATVVCFTRATNEPLGVWVRLEGGRIVAQRARARPPGTTITVEELFRLHPARLAFLRSPAAELAAIANVVTNLALAFPEVRFRLLNEGKELLATPGTGDLREAVLAIYGLETAEALVPFQHAIARHGASLQVSGYTSPVTITRARRDHYRFLLNRRPIQSRLLARAVDEAYRARLPSGRFPVLIAHLTVPPSLVDVNVHPAKAEVRFRDEGAVFRLLYDALVAALEPLAPIAANGDDAALGLATVAPSLVSPAAPDDASQTPTGGPSPALGPASQPPAASHQPQLLPASAVQAGPLDPQAAAERTRLPLLRVLGQLANTYIVAEGPEGMFLVDQHAAHERLLYDRLLAGLVPQPQGLLQPALVELTPAQAARLQECAPAVAEMGFHLEPFGGTRAGSSLERAYLLRAVPAPLVGRDPARALLDFLDAIEGSPGLDWRQRAAATIACHGATRAGDPLSMEAMRDLLRQLEAAQMPRTCPHGRPTLLYLSAEQLQRQFGRRW